MKGTTEILHDSSGFQAFIVSRLRASFSAGSTRTRSSHAGDWEAGCSGRSKRRADTGGRAPGTTPASRARHPTTSPVHSTRPVSASYARTRPSLPARNTRPVLVATMPVRSRTPPVSRGPPRGDRRRIVTRRDAPLDRAAVQVVRRQRRVRRSRCRRHHAVLTDIADGRQPLHAIRVRLVSAVAAVAAVLRRAGDSRRRGRSRRAARGHDRTRAAAAAMRLGRANEGAPSRRYAITATSSASVMPSTGPIRPIPVVTIVRIASAERRFAMFVKCRRLGHRTAARLRSVAGLAVLLEHRRAKHARKGWP